jgi:hypothetical protein
MPTPRTTEPKPVHAAWAAVMADVQSLSKDQRNSQQGYAFRGIDDVMNKVGPVFRAHGVFVLPEKIVEVRSERYETRKDAVMHGVMLTVQWRIYGPAGDSVSMETVGEAADAGDKATSKAHSVAYRTALLEALCLPTGDPDPDSETHERATRGQRGATTRNDDAGHRVTDPADPPPPDPATDAAVARANLAAEARRLQVGIQQVADEFAAAHDGRRLGEATAAEVQAFTAAFTARHEAQAAAS